MKTFQETEVVCIATTEERHYLWKDNHEQWEDDSTGDAEILGNLEGMPVVIARTWGKVNGKMVMFIEPTSQVVDYRMIDKWIEDTLPHTTTTDVTHFWRDV
jgi:hypothetical protein